MPLIYDVRCAACGHAYRTSDMRLAVQLDDGTLVPLRHPGEHHDLAAAGFSWKQAHDEARLVRSESLICKYCGGPYERRRLVPPQGCLSGIVAVIAIATLAAPLGWVLFPGRYSPGRQATIGVFALVGIALAVVWLLRRWESRSFRRHLPRRPVLQDGRCCARATRRSLVKLGTIACWLRRFPCAECGGTTARARAVGIS